MSERLQRGSVNGTLADPTLGATEKQTEASARILQGGTISDQWNALNLRDI